MAKLSPFLLLLLAIPSIHGYSVLTHEAIIDSSWDRQLKPLLLARFPNANDEDMRKAHAYCYGGAIIQDMGYYPFGSHFFSDLTHYARSGDFILALIRDSQDLNEYAFALGALAHFASDNQGHPIAINRAVPMVYPQLGKKYGPVVTYEDDPKAHLKTEFAFDVIEVARGKYVSEDYHDFIGFEVAQALLERAFEETYSLHLKDQFRSIDLALGTYRYAVGKLIPEMTKTAWSAKKDEIEKLQAGMTKRRFVYRLSRASYHQEWDRQYQRPGIGAQFLAWLFHIVPKIGPFRALAFKVPPVAAERLFLASFNDTLREYRRLLADVQEHQLRLTNENFDIGQPTRFGQYRMADAVYDQLLERLSETPGKVSPELRANIMAFYQGSGEPSSEKARSTLVTLRGQ